MWFKIRKTDYGPKVTTSQNGGSSPKFALIGSVGTMSRPQWNYSFNEERTEVIFGKFYDEEKIWTPSVCKTEEDFDTDRSFYCHYHQTSNHETKKYWILRNRIEGMIHKGTLVLSPDYFLKKEESMIIRKDRPK